MGRPVPEQDDLAAVDLDDLDVVDALGVCEQRRRAPCACDDQPVGAVRLHRGSAVVVAWSRSRVAGAPK